MMKRVVIVGAGALGSHVAMLLRNAAELAVVDFDRVEAKNVLSQFHWQGGVDRKKVQSLQALMQSNFRVRIEAWDIKLDEANAERVIKPAHLPRPDVIVDAVDNAAGRRACQGIATKIHVPCLHGGLAANGAFGMVRWDEAFLIHDEPTGTPTCEDGEALPFIGLVSSYMAHAAQLFLKTGEKRGYAVAPDGATRV